MLAHLGTFLRYEDAVIDYLHYFYRMASFCDVKCSCDAQRSSLGLQSGFMCLPIFCILVEDKPLSTTLRVSYK